MGVDIDLPPLSPPYKGGGVGEAKVFSHHEA